MNRGHKNDDGPFSKNIFPENIFPRRIFPWMGNDDDEQEKTRNDKSKTTYDQGSGRYGEK